MCMPITFPGHGILQSCMEPMYACTNRLRWPTPTVPCMMGRNSRLAHCAFVYGIHPAIALNCSRFSLLILLAVLTLPWYSPGIHCWWATSDGPTLEEATR